jgi:hypothetical protein
MNQRLETFIGIGLLLVAVLGFIFSLITGLPNQDQVKAQAKPIPEIPRDFFSSDNPVANKIRELNVPAGVPVTVDPGNLGRTNVFENF